MISYRKIGGLHWLSIGSLRISWCIKRQPKYKPLPKALQLEELLDSYNEYERPYINYGYTDSPSYRNAMHESGRGRLLR